VRIAVHARSVPAGGRLARAIAGLRERGHDVVAPERGAAGAARCEVDVVVGGARPLGPAWLAALSRSRALVLALEAEAHRAWSPLDRWAWSLAGGYGLIAEADVEAFLAQAPEHERERISLWPSAAPESEPSVHPDTQVLERCCERALARRSAGPGRGALFVDRDGTVIVERNHLSEPGEVQLLPGVAEALRTARAAGHPVVVVSNQAGVGRGLFPETSVHAAMARLRALLRAEGVELDAVRHCPHAPEAGCDCRKPRTLLLREAAEDLRLSLRDSIMVGDKWIDVEAGRGVGASTALVRTGHGLAELASGTGPGAAAPDLVCDDLPAAVRWFLGRQH